MKLCILIMFNQLLSNTSMNVRETQGIRAHEMPISALVLSSMYAAITYF